MSDLFQTIIHSDLFMLTATIALYVVGGALYRRTRIILVHPVLLTFIAMIGILSWCGIDYEEYRAATSVLEFALGLSVVALGYLMYEQLEHIRGNLLTIGISTVVGCLVGILSVVYIASLFGTEREIVTSLAPKSVTVPIAVAVVEPLGGIISITSVVVFCVGIFGSLFGETILRFAGVTDPQALGYALGSASHGVGTARAIEIGAIEGALSGLAMALMGLTTALLLPLIEKFLY